jgi:hypothetical protein
MSKLLSGRGWIRQIHLFKRKKVGLINQAPTKEKLISFGILMGLDKSSLTDKTSPYR